MSKSHKIHDVKNKKTQHILIQSYTNLVLSKILALSVFVTFHKYIVIASLINACYFGLEMTRKGK